MNYNRGSESLGNLMKAFEHESSGHVRYMILTDNAKNNGNHDLARLYKQLADEEYAHARNWYREMNGAEEENALKNSFDDEEKEYKFTYPQLAARAELEGYEKLADMFNATGNVEGEHSRIINRYMSNTKDNTRYQASEDVVWRCSVCGHTHMGTTPPDQCPLCGYNRTVYSYQ